MRLKPRGLSLMKEKNTKAEIDEEKAEFGNSD